MQFVLECKHRRSARVAQFVDRKSKILLPALNGTHAAAQFGGYFFPSLKGRVGCGDTWSEPDYIGFRGPRCGSLYWQSHSDTPRSSLKSSRKHKLRPDS